MSLFFICLWPGPSKKKEKEKKGTYGVPPFHSFTVHWPNCSSSLSLFVGPVPVNMNENISSFSLSICACAHDLIVP